MTKDDSKPNKRKAGRPPGSKNKTAPSNKVLNQIKRNNVLVPTDFVSREEGEPELEYKRLIDFCMVPELERTPKLLGKRWNLSENQVSNRMVRFTRRAQPWKNHLDTLVTKACVESYIDQGISLAEEHTKMWNDVREVGKRVINRLLSDPNFLLTVSPKEALAFLDASFKADRLLAGESTSNVSMNAMLLDTTSLSLQEKKDLHALILKSQATSTEPTSNS